MSTPNYFYRDKENREIGPISMSAIAQLRETGILTDETPVRLDNAVEWLTCKTVVAIAGSSASTSSVPVGDTSLGNGNQTGVSMQKIGGLSWIFFALAGLSFTLPFFGVSSFGPISFTGQQLIMGDKALSIAPYSYPAVTVAFVVTMAGLILALIRKREASIASGLFGIGGIIALVVAKNTIENEALQKAHAIIQLDFKEGFWFVVVSLAIGAIWQFKYGGVAGSGKVNPQK